jgi:HSP20 family protein
LVLLKGEKQTEREEKGETWFFSERAYGSFSRSFRLPPDADAEAVSAELKDGLLTISVRKKAQGAPEGARKVQIGKG